MKNRIYATSLYLVTISAASFARSPSVSDFGELRVAPLFEGHTRAQHEAFGSKYVITSSGEGASNAGKEMFQQGGNIFDAAAAITFAISVERPQSTGIGGGGFMMIHNPRKMKDAVAVDFREVAPLAATQDMYLKDGTVVAGKSLDGIHSVAVPGLVAGILEIHQKYGKLALKTVMEPAIKLAENGFKVYPHLAKAIDMRKEFLKQSPAGRAIFLKSGSEPLKTGDTLVQKDLAKTLREIAAKGKDGFYKGWVRDAILAESKRLGGILSEGDFAEYKVAWRKALHGKYRGFDVFSMPPSSSGGAHIIEILNILEGFNLKQFGPQSPQAIHLTASAMQRAFADRAQYLGDSDFVKVPVKGLTSKRYATLLRKEIADQKGRAVASSAVKAGLPLPYEHDETTHFSIMDQEGNMIASTQTVNWFMGAGVVVPGTGIVLNDEMDDFAAKVGDANVFGAIGGNNNLIQPKKRPLSSMSPTLISRGKDPVMSVGAPGGTRIITCVLLTALNYMEYGLPLYESVGALRYHHQWMPDQIRTEAPNFSAQARRDLEAKGYKIKEEDLGCKVNAIVQEKGKLHGVADQRSEGLAIGDLKE